jgi:hypothetical protein
MNEPPQEPKLPRRLDAPGENARGREATRGTERR